MSNLFSSTRIINHLINHELIEKQVIKMLGSKIRKGYGLDYFYSGPEGLTCLIVEQMAYSEEEYTEVIPWAEIDQWVEKNTRREYEVAEAFEKIRQAYLKSD